MKRIMTICLSLCLMMLAGCADNKTYPPITLDPGNGEVRSISIDDAIEKKNDGENFLLIVTQTYCGYCEGETQDMLLSSEEQVTLESYQTWLKENHIIEEDE